MAILRCVTLPGPQVCLLVESLGWLLGPMAGNEEPQVRWSTLPPLLPVLTCFWLISIGLFQKFSWWDETKVSCLSYNPAGLRRLSTHTILSFPRGRTYKPIQPLLVASSVDYGRGRGSMKLALLPFPLCSHLNPFFLGEGGDTAAGASTKYV